MISIKCFKPCQLCLNVLKSNLVKDFSLKETSQKIVKACLLQILFLSLVDCYLKQTIKNLIMHLHLRTYLRINVERYKLIKGNLKLRIWFSVCALLNITYLFDILRKTRKRVRNFLMAGLLKNKSKQLTFEKNFSGQRALQNSSDWWSFNNNWLQNFCYQINRATSVVSISVLKCERLGFMYIFLLISYCRITLS